MDCADLIPIFYELYKAKPTESIYEHTRELLRVLEKLEEYFESIGKKLPYKHLIVLACVYHDIGKVTLPFQERMKTEGLFNPDIEVAHNILSACLAKNFLKVSDKDEERIIIYAILNHHMYVNNIEYMHENDDFIQESLSQIAKELSSKSHLDNCEFKLIGERERVKLQNIENNPDIKSILVKGFLHKCDYAASAHRDVEFPKVDLDKRLSKLSFSPNAIQKFAKEHSDSNIILIGSTGLGKTEAALWWIGSEKGFYVLPLKTAINAMYNRIIEALCSDDYEETLGLLHGDTQSLYFNDHDEGSDETSVGYKKSDEDIEEDKLWRYYDMTRAIALPLTVATPDQIFLCAFKYPGYEAQLATYSYSKIVIDEIQAYSPDILATLIYGLHQIVKVGGKFAITTATLPPFIEYLLNKDSKEKIEYEKKEGFHTQVRHKVKLIDQELSPDDIIDFMHKKVGGQSAKILVVLNTVKKAQMAYRKISKSIEEEFNKEFEINILHSRYTIQDRADKEKKIITDGKTKCRKKVVWITTQVVEASLDIDFDYLFTELSDLSALLQRMGRCNRKGSKSTSEYNCFVYTKIDCNLIRMPKANRTSQYKGFIYESLFELSKDALSYWESLEHNGMMSEEDKHKMIEDFFDIHTLEEYEKKFPSSSYLEEYNGKYRHLSNLMPNSSSLKQVKHEFRNIISFKAIPKVLYQDNYAMIGQLLDDIEIKRQEAKKTCDESKKKKIRTDMLRLKNQIHQFTLSVGVWNLRDSACFKIGHEKIYLINNRYDSDTGLHGDEKEEEGGIFV